MKVVIKINNIFPVNKNEIDLVKFIGQFQILSMKDVPYFFNTTYAPKRIARLVNNGILYKYKKNLLLSNNGKAFLTTLGQKYYPPKYDEKYTKRLKFISHLAVLFKNDPFINFKPSYEIKEKTAYTESSRKYIGLFNIFGTNYLTYHIDKDNSIQYLNSIIYDIQKEHKHKNFIILIDNIDKIYPINFAFGNNTVIICEDTEKELLKLKYLYKINWNKVISNLYNNQVNLSKYNFCDYTNNKNKFISVFALFDTEKINRIVNFMSNNPDKQVDIICPIDILQLLKSEIPNAKYKIIDFEKFLERDIKIYD